MSFFNSVKEKFIRAGQIAHDTLLAVDVKISDASVYIDDHQPVIANATKKTIEAGGRGIKRIGKSIQSGSKAISDYGENRPPSDGKITSILVDRVIIPTAFAAGFAGRLASGIGSGVEKAGPAIGAATAGVVNGIGTTAAGASSSIAISERRLNDLRARLDKVSISVKARSDEKIALIERAQKEHRKKDLMDLLVVGGVSLSALIADPSNVPAEIEQAFRLAYPVLTANGESFADVVERLPSDDLLGLVSGVKGKLFEIELVDHLNAGNLQEGLHAQLTGSATQPGFDIEIVDNHGDIVDVLQAKATESVAYVKEALERYPDIDVTTTSEVHAHLMALGAAEHASNSGIAESILQQKVEAAVAAGDHLDMMDFVPSTIGLAFIAITSLMDKSLTIEEASAEIGKRSAVSGMAGAAGAAVLAATNLWWLGLATGLGSRFLVIHGGSKRQRFEVLEQAIWELEKPKMVSRFSSKAGLLPAS